MIVYEATHTTTGMRYIGSTVQSISSRWRAHCSIATQTDIGLSPLQEAIRAYGPDAFLVREIACARTVEDLRKTEAAIIVQEGTNWPKGFNALRLAGYRDTRFGQRHMERRARKAAASSRLAILS